MIRGLALALLVTIPLGGCDAPPETAVAVGTLEWDRVEVIARVAEPVVAWDAREGTRVAAGQSLLRLDERRLAARVAAARAQHAQAAARLAEIERGTRPEQIAAARARLNGAEQTLRFQQRELDRLAGLQQRQLIAPEQVDQARNALAVARAERDAARATLDELREGATAEERDQARAALAAAEAALRAARLDLDLARIAAPVTGQLDELPFRVGERPFVGAVVAVILSGERPYARIYVPEAIRVHVVPGTRAKVHVDGIESAFDGAVRKVSAEPSFTPYFALTEADRGRLSFVAEVDIAPDDRLLPAGVPVQVRFTESGPGD